MVQVSINPDLIVLTFIHISNDIGEERLATVDILNNLYSFAFIAISNGPGVNQSFCLNFNSRVKRYW